MQFFLLQGAQDLVTVEPAASQNGAATAQQYNYDNDNDHSGVVLFGFFSNGGHLIVHDIYSYFEK
jgi:hypothetical protein